MCMCVSIGQKKKSIDMYTTCSLSIYSAWEFPRATVLSGVSINNLILRKNSTDYSEDDEKNQENDT